MVAMTSEMPVSRAARPLDPTLTAIGLAMVVSLALTLPALALDPRQFRGESVWLKPVKFQMALAIYLLTLAWFSRWLPEAVLAGRRMRIFLSAVAFGTVAEMLWIGGAAMFATASHYNSNPAMYAIYALMGAVAVLLTTVSLVFGMAFWRDRSGTLAEPLRLSLALGLILTFALTLPAAGTLSGLPGHFIGTPVTGDAVPVMGWSREVGDLRLAHFLATHALHAVPLAGLAAQAVLPRGLASGAVWGAAGLYAALTALAFVLALMGRPFPLL